METKDRIVRYWTERSEDFEKLRHAELDSYMARLWMKEMGQHLSKKKSCRILDVGTGCGFFAILLAKEGYDVEGIDLTAAMIKRAEELAFEEGVSVPFHVMDAESLEYPDESFDIVIARNLTWTLPNPEKAYCEWLRVLKKGGMLLNYDGDYGKETFEKERKHLPEQHVHNRVNRSLLAECDAIKRELDISRKIRPLWDMEFLRAWGCESVSADTGISDRIYLKQDEFYNPTPMFLIRVIK